MLTYSTRGLESSAKVAYWNDVNSSVLTPVKTRPSNPSQFDAEMRCLRYGRLRMANAVSQPATVSRPELRASDHGEHLFFLRVLLQGQLVIRRDDRDIRLDEGDLVLSDATLPYTLTYEKPCSTLLLIVTEDDLRKHLPSPEEVVGVKLSGATGLSRTTSLMLKSVWEQADLGFPHDLGSRMADSLLDVFATAWMATKGSVVPETASVGTHRIKIKRYIEANLRDPELDLRSVAAAFGLSRRYLHLVFTSEKETLLSFIRRRRIEECCKQLTDVLWQRRTITEIAFSWGFNNMTHFARVFRNHYGVSPRTYRKMHLSFERQNGAC
ncbi:MAG: helix-turn-helix domain-containing protein [Rhizomicrobium sp.]